MIFIISLAKLLKQLKIFKVRTGMTLLFLLVNGIIIIALGKFLRSMTDVALMIMLFKLRFSLILFIMFVSVIFYEDIYEGHFNPILLSTLAFLLGINVYYYTSFGVMYIYVGGSVQADVIASYQLILYEAITAIASAYYGLQIFLRGRKKFRSKLFRRIIDVFGVFTFINFFNIPLYLLCFTYINMYYEIRPILQVTYIIYFLLLSIVTIWRPGFYLVNAFNAYYFVVYDRNSGLPIYIRNYIEDSKSLDLLSNLLTALEHLSEEIIKTMVRYVVTMKHAIVIESEANIGVSVSVEKYHPNVSKLLKLFLKRIRENIEAKPRLHEMIQSSIIYSDDIKAEIEKEVANTLSYILP